MESRWRATECTAWYACRWKVWCKIKPHNKGDSWSKPYPRSFGTFLGSCCLVMVVDYSSFYWWLLHLRWVWGMQLISESCISFMTFFLWLRMKTSSCFIFVFYGRLVVCFTSIVLFWFIPISMILDLQICAKSFVAQWVWLVSFMRRTRVQIPSPSLVVTIEL